MLWNAKNGNLPLDGTDMDYISFGRGDQVLVVLPGLGDGLKTARGMALPFAALYRIYAKSRRVYVFSRKNRLEPGCSTRDMAEDVASAMHRLGLTGADLLGVSQGGMIAQHLAIDHPELVRRLVLAVTLARPNPFLEAAVARWTGQARAGDYMGLMVDTAERTYSEGYLKTHRWLYPLLGRVGKPKDFSRFLIQAEACLHHDAYDRLDRITCPTLVVGGGRDQIVGPEAAGEIAGRVRDSRLLVYPELGHGAYEEAGDFHRRVLDFLDGPR